MYLILNIDKINTFLLTEISLINMTERVLLDVEILLSFDVN